MISQSGRIIDGHPFKAAGYMKASPDGTKLALANNKVGVDLFNFDNSTGKVSNSIELLTADEPYGVEFSPNSALLYVTEAKKDSVIIARGVCQLFVPNAFTPNGDGLNDVFRSSFGEDVTKYKLQVYDRWGNKVFETTELRGAWDGTNRSKKLPAFMHILNIRFH